MSFREEKLRSDASAILECTDWKPATGARFSTTMEVPGQWKVESTGRFTEVDPPRGLAYTTDANPAMNTPPMDVRVELEEIESGRTRLTLTHTGMPSDEICGFLRAGWTSSLAELDAVLAGRR